MLSISNTYIEAGKTWKLKEIDTINGAILKLLSVGFNQEDIAVITGYSEQKRRLTEKTKEHGWSDVKQIITIDSSQADEYKIVFISLVTTRNLAGSIDTRSRACVGTSRQIEALYFIGQADY